MACRLSDCQATARPRRSPRDHLAGKKVDEFLKARLAQGPISVNQLYAEAAEQQISSSSLRKAKDRLGIVSHFIPAKDGHGGSWTWQLPAPSKSDPAELRDAQGDQEEQRVWWWESGMNLARGSAPCEKLAP